LAHTRRKCKAKTNRHNCRIDCTSAGKRRAGIQRYRWGQCGKSYSEHKEFNNLFNQKQAVPDDKALLALQLLVEGISIRSAERLTGLQRDTIMRLLVEAGERRERL
jgi:transposase-like protein